MITKPMLAETVQDLKSIKFPVLATPKLDGIRCLVVNGRALSRKFKPIPNHYIRNWIEAHCPDGFDGEIVCVGKTFNETQSLVMTEEGEPDFYYWVFDYVKDDTTTSYVKRLDHLREWMREPYNHTKLVFLFPEHIPDLPHLEICIKQHKLDGYEGTMIRDPEGQYKNGRSTLKQGWLLKIKEMMDSEAKIIGFEEKLSNNNELETNELGYAKRSSKQENLVPAGTLGSLNVKDVVSGVEFSIGTGFDDITRQAIWNNKDAYLGKILTYTYQPSGTKDKPRFPSFKGFRNELDM